MLLGRVKHANTASFNEDDFLMPLDASNADPIDWRKKGAVTPVKD